ncbi:hypothetical protein EDEG_01803 [Edhazardia aedis USNM 41457]|uniref:Uncharacterized protein n=1 Tax=Edhazardia aedis (strain USNM 41457) TaxID=1003232 RepID=J9D8S1_EDHAE|nr:hypothetical protein EDEG_01803 [Edhazardia aedis USNM 41457]|eukprot:EJW03909.1 hypothetical protein EDEG_01803 [Edhazardia aedis USNM 41457]
MIDFLCTLLKKMFTPLNNKEIIEKQKTNNLEKNQLIKIYIHGLKTKNYDVLKSYNLKNSINEDIFNLINKYLMYNYMKDTDTKNISSEAMKSIASDSFLCIEFLNKLLNEKNFVRARKVITFCIKSGFINCRFIRLRKRFIKMRQIN